MGMGEALEEWEYEYHPEAHSVSDACLIMLQNLQNNKLEMEDVMRETRPYHKVMFERVTPFGREYLAGNYRGASYPQLVDRPVYIYGFSCAHFSQVEDSMRDFHQKLNADIQRISQYLKQSKLDAAQKIVAFSQFVSHYFVRFLSIHPYANGNGHISRLLVWCIFNFKSIKCSFWSVPDRNLNPPDQYVGDFRLGNKSPLVKAFADLIERENSAQDFH